MKLRYILFFISFIISTANAQDEPFGTQNYSIKKNINSNWTFNYFPDDDVKGCESVGYNDSRWPVVSIPHTWVLYETTGELFPFYRKEPEDSDFYWWTGQGWYRKHFTISKDQTEKKVFIEFTGIQEQCKIWINGKFLGDRKDIFYDITDHVNPGENNVLAVSVSNRKITETRWQQDRELFSGIYGDVNVILKNKLFIATSSFANNSNSNQVYKSPEVSGKEGLVSVTAWVKNDFAQQKNFSLQTSISDASGKIVTVIKSTAAVVPGELLKIEQVSKAIKKPNIWSEENPYVYNVKIEILEGKEVVDSWIAPSGLRFNYTGPSSVISSDINADKWFLTGLEDVKMKAENPGSSLPGEILLTPSHKSIIADRGSIAVVTADITGPEINKTFKWSISGPGRLVGPSHYESFPVKVNKDVWSGDLPFSNVIRSTGEPGVIYVSLSAPGFASVTIDIDASKKNSGSSLITEPELNDNGRRTVITQKMGFSRLDEVPRELNIITSDISLKSKDQAEFSTEMKEIIYRNNLSVDTASVEFKTLTGILSSHLFNNNGQLSAFDFNYNTGNYNNCRLISGYVNATKLPALFKEGLRTYYAGKIIAQGNELNAGDEMNWLNWIPSGGTVVICTETRPLPLIKGAVVTDKNDLEEIIAAVHPSFVKYSAEAKERALVFISKMNPYVHNYIAEKDQPVIVPLLKFISE
jgi:hypothetical protein